jgi:hypothetical protein
MTSTSTERTRDDGSTSSVVAEGTAMFAAVMLVTVALFQIFQGIAAVAEDTIYVRGLDYTYELDVTTWGWTHIVLGAVGVAVGAAILAGQAWGLIAGIVVAILSSLANFAFMPYYPFWSLAILAFNGLVLWALCNQRGRAGRSF